MRNKEYLRCEFLKIRDNVKDKLKKSEIIESRIKNLPIFLKANKVAIYNNLSSEVETKNLIKYLISQKKQVYLPRVEKTHMEFYRIDDLNQLSHKNKFGVYEPNIINENLLNKNSIDIIIVPGICFDKNKNRIGFGKGFYDKYLADVKRTIKIGICFEEQILKDGFIDSEETDIKMDMIITDKNIYT